MFRKSGLVLAVLLSFIPVLAAQNQDQSQEEDRESDISVNFTGLYGIQEQNNGIKQSVSNSAGGLVTYRYRFGSRWGIDLNYGLSRNTDYYTVNNAGTPLSFYSIQSDVHELTGDVLFRAFHHGRLSPYILLGGGALIFAPTGISYGTSEQVRELRPAAIYGGGTEVSLIGNFALRVQYRGLFYKIPDFGISTINPGIFTHTAEPSVGIVYRFSMRHF